MSGVTLSVCIVSYESREYLEGCLNSIYANPPDEKYEIVVVDNHSSDDTVKMLATEFPEVTVIENTANLGFTVPMNQALRQAQGQYFLLLNPDTIVYPQALTGLVGFMDSHPHAGISGPKVLNTDGSMQQPCRRGESRPLAVISYFLGLNRLFPRSKLFGEYLMNYMDEDATHEVAGVSGSCMLIRREVIGQIGYLDEQFFAYQEDADYCFQARKVGWKVYYVPTSRITHYGGQGGSRVEPYRSIYEWHRSYWLHYRKNFAGDYFFVFNWFYYALMLLKLVFSLGINFLSREKYAGRQKPK